MAEARRVHPVPLCLCYSGGRLCLLQGEGDVSNVSEGMSSFVHVYTFMHMHPYWVPSSITPFSICFWVFVFIIIVVIIIIPQESRSICPSPSPKR